ncbi:MAG: hypothetical protein B6I20_13790, partial [Bacteroidetes bacterium 4572_117]
YIYYKKHPTRKHGVEFDKYYRTEYQVNKKRVAINFGWLSEGWKQHKCLSLLEKYKKNAKNGKRPISLKDEKELAKEKEAEKERLNSQQHKDTITIHNYFYNVYYPLIQKQKAIKTYQREESLFRIWIDSCIGDMPFKKISKADIDGIFYNVT